MSETSTVIEFYLSEAGPSGLGDSTAPFGFYAAEVEKFEIKAISSGKNAGRMGLTLWTTVIEGTDEDAVGKSVRPYIVFTKKDDEPGGKTNAMTAKIKRFMRGLTDDSEKQEKYGKATGNTKMDFAKHLPKGKRIYLVNDPADRSCNENDEIQLVTKAEYEELLSGDKKYRRKNTHGLNAEQAAALGLSKAQGSAKDAIEAGGTVADSGWTPPVQGASVNGQAPKPAGKKAAAPPPVSDDGDDLFA